MTYGDFDDEFEGPTEPLKQTDTLIISEVGQPSRYVSVELPVVTLGRSVDNDIVLQDPQVSRLHARVLRDARGTYTIEDLDSRNGTYLDGVRLFPNRPQRWNESQEVRVGPYYIKLMRVVQWSDDMEPSDDDLFYGSPEDVTKVGPAVREEDYDSKVLERARRAEANADKEVNDKEVNVKEVNVDETRPEFPPEGAPGFGGGIPSNNAPVGGLVTGKKDTQTIETPVIVDDDDYNYDDDLLSEVGEAEEADERELPSPPPPPLEAEPSDAPKPAKPITPPASASPITPPQPAPASPRPPAPAPAAPAPFQPEAPEPAPLEPIGGETEPPLQQAPVLRDGRGQINTDVALETQFAAYYPREMQPQVWLPLTAYVYRASAADTVAKDAEKQLGGLISVMRRVAQVARRAIPTGTLITATPYLPGFQFNPPQIAVGFFEEWHRFDFKMRSVDAPSYQSANGLLTFTVDGIIVADVPLSVFVTPDESVANAPNVLTTQKLYDSIFCSYSHTDTVIIERVERVYRALGLDFLRDVHTLRSGQHWSDEIYAMIDKANIFQLFWSHTAAQSQYVEKEWRYALKLNRDEVNFIRPVYWQAPMPDVPSDLGHIHFAYEPELDD